LKILSKEEERTIITATVTKAFFRGYKWFAVHGINIKEVLTDNGSEGKIG
jgi:hypothetical protein